MSISHLKLRTPMSLIAAMAAALSFADVSYTVTPHVVVGGQSTLAVEMTFPRTSFDTDVQMPNWAPGAYIFAGFAKGVQNLKITDENGNEMPFVRPNDYTWRVSSASAKKLTVRYDINANYDDGSIAYSGPSTYLYVVNRKTDPCTLDLETPQGWRIAIGLVPDKSGHRFNAKTYDVLADNPVTMGDFLEGHYTVRGKDHEVALRGTAKSDVDMQRLLKATKFVSTMETDFFGNIPYDRYVWHFSVRDAYDGAGGLEHLSSTQISLSSGVGPRAVTVLAHEFFHLWNVKRIRSAVLGPFDYTKLPETGALWWLEGVTDYYSHFLLHRYGWWADQDLYSDIMDQVEGVRKNDNRFKISPYDSSFRVKESNNGRGNSNGLLVSYYNTGWVLGMCLDIEIRSQSHGKHSLDDVEHALWRMCRNDQPGFPEDEIRTQCVAYGGPSLGDFYDKYVMHPGELPVEEELAKVGLRIVDTETSGPSLGFHYQGTRAAGGARVTQVTDDSCGVKAGDVVTDIDGKVLAGKSAAAIQSTVNLIVKNSKPGTPIHLKLLRKSTPDAAPTPMELDVNPKVTTTKGKAVEADPSATADQVRLREGWFWGPKGKPAEIVGP